MTVFYIFRNTFDYKGVDRTSAYLFQAAASSWDRRASIAYVDSAYLAAALEKGVGKKILYLGGGSCSQWDVGLDATTLEKIRQFVASGHSIFCICAGAYFSCAFSVFEATPGQLIAKERGLRLFSGSSKGPLYQGNVPGQQAVSLRAVKVRWHSGKVGYLPFNGGGYFVASEAASDCYVLATYEEEPAERSIAAVKVTVKGQGEKKGVGVLCFLHLEYDVATLDQTIALASGEKKKQLEEVRDKLAPCEDFRQEVLGEIFQLLCTSD